MGSDGPTLSGNLIGRRRQTEVNGRNGTTARTWITFAIMVAAASAASAVFVFAQIASHTEKEHTGLYKPQFKGDSVQLYVERVKDGVEDGARRLALSVKEHNNEQVKQLTKLLEASLLKQDELMKSLHRIEVDVAKLKMKAGIE
jgi:hypothetical protein